jgi:4-hydroxyphenylpyruvate dioxygenase
VPHTYTLMSSQPSLKLVGYASFKRSNPKTDKFGVKRFHHIEFVAGDALNVSRRWALGLGMALVAKSDQSTGNSTYASYVMQTNDVKIVFTAPYAASTDKSQSKIAHPRFDVAKTQAFFSKHGVAASAIGIEVENAEEAYRIAVENGAIGWTEPTTLVNESTGAKAVVSEVQLYLKGDVALRFISFSQGYDQPFLPGYETVKEGSPRLNYGIKRIDHAVGNVHELIPQIEYVAKFTGFHEFAEFTAADVGTVNSGLNSMVLASNNELVLLPFNEPTFGTKRKSQIQTYLEQNDGEGLQHLALKTDDIFATMRNLKSASKYGGFEYMPPASDSYYDNLPAKIGDTLTPEQYKEIRELGLLADKDDQGVLLQIFSKPCSDRPTFFVEIIQRIGCMVKNEQGEEEQKGGCGGFGKGNFSELFKSIEDYERILAC